MNEDFEQCNCVDAFLQKPISIRNLIDAVETQEVHVTWLLNSLKMNNRHKANTVNTKLNLIYSWNSRTDCRSTIFNRFPTA